MSGSSRFQPGEGPSRGLLCDCTTSPIHRFAALIFIVISPLSSILATLISSFEPWDHGNLDCNEWAGRWCPIKLAGNAAELGGGYTQFGHYNYFYDLLNYASPPN